MLSPSEYFKLPVLGKIITKRTEGTVTNLTTNKTEPHIMESEEYEFISEEKDFYVCNQWYKEYKKIPQLVPKEFVEKKESY